MRWTVPAALAVGTVVAASAAAWPTSHGSARNQSPDWSPDGSKILFTTNRGGGGETWLMNADGTDPVNLSGGATAPSTNAVFSPDGRRIAFSTSVGGDWNIYVMNADGSGRTAVTRNPAEEFHPAWSPDGTRVAFSRRNEARQRSEIFTIRIDGTDERAVAPEGDNSVWSWSPDGTKIAFQSQRDGNSELYVMNADGTGQTRLTTTPTRQDGEPAWSPDGTRIAFSAGTEGRRDIYLMNADGSGERRLTTLDLPVWGPRWSRDGARIVFFEFPPGHIYVVPSGGGTPTVVNPVDRSLVLGPAIASPVPTTAGRALTVTVTVGTASGLEVVAAAVSCRAKIGPKTLRVLRKGFSSGRASCTWDVPRTAKRKRVAGSVTVSTAGSSAKRQFVLAVR